MKYDSPLIKTLTTMANMLIVSFLWFACCLGIVTIIPSTAALYHTCVKAVFIDEPNQKIVRCFFDSFRQAIKPGIILSIICVVLGFLIYTGFDTGLQIYSLNSLGAAYMALAVLFSLIFVAGLVYLSPVVSRFELDAGSALRLALYFSSQKLIQTLWFVGLLCLLVYAIDLFPLFIVFLPALYVDLIRGAIEKQFAKYIEDNHLNEG